jgi:catechol 2,3-dioxygenase-like lactoylglutathione lyase family enzyme
MRITDAVVPPRNEQSVVRGEYLSHGTMECYSLPKSRRFYEAFLGLECVRHASSAMAVRCGLRFHIVCLEVGNTLKPVSQKNHWGIDVGSVAEVDRIHRAATELKNHYDIRTVTDCVKQHGVYSFYLEDLDHNWWEIQYYEGTQHDDMFDFGDQFGDSDLSESVAAP